MDDAVVVFLNRAARGRPRVRRLIGSAARQLAGVEIALMLLLAASGRRRSALRMLAAVSAVYVTSEVAGQIWPRSRPFEELAGVTSLTPHSTGRSFPSRHVASGLAMAAIGAREHPRLGSLMATTAWLLGLSRVAAGLHFPTDVLAGAALGEVVGRLMRRV